MVDERPDFRVAHAVSVARQALSKALFEPVADDLQHVGADHHRWKLRVVAGEATE